MQFLMIVVIFMLMLPEYLGSADVHLIPGFAKFIPEVFSMITAVIVLVRAMHQNLRYVDVKYLLVFASLTIVIICGIVANQVAPGPVLAGMRYYLRAIPFFLLPAVYDFKDGEIRRIMQFILGFCLLQVPLAVFQRYRLAMTGHNSGDHVFGTLMASGVLSMFLICALCILTALMIRGRISKIALLILFLLFVLPMSINETKITIFALPFGLMVTAIVGSPREKRIGVAMYASALILGGALIFIPLYNFFNTFNNYDKWDPNKKTRIQDIIGNPDFLASYLNTKASVGSGKEAGRVDALVVPFQELSKDPVKFGFGVGLGNATSSSIGPQFTGRYQPIYGIYSVETSMATFTLETGMFGFLLVLLLHWFVFRDAISMMRVDDGLVGTIALGWIGVSILVLACNFYITTHTSSAMSYIFWFFSGLIAAKSTRLAAERNRTRRKTFSAAPYQPA